MHSSYIVTGLIATVFILGFALVSYREREYRATRVSLVITALFAFCWFLSGAMFGPQTAVMALWFWLLLIVSCTALALPGKSGSPVRLIKEKLERYDERNILFGRMCLEEGSWQYDHYYTQVNPKMKELDDKLRSMPQMGAPGGKYANGLDSPYIDAVYEYISKFRNLADPGPVTNPPVSLSAEQATIRIKGFARQLGAADVRITRLLPHHVYSHAGRQLANWGEEYEATHRYAIVVSTEMDPQLIRNAPLAPSGLEAAIRYMKVANIAISLATYLRDLGYPSRAHVDGNYQVITTALAHDSGLGELSRLGLVVTEGEGARVRLAAVTTDIPLVEDGPVDIGIQDFCERCKKCASNCPSGSIPFGEKKDDRGIIKWTANQETCYQFWRHFGTDCALCVAVCPYSKPNTFYHRLIKFFVVRNRYARRLALLLDDLFYGRTPRHRDKPGWFQDSGEQTGLVAERDGLSMKQTSN